MADLIDDANSYQEVMLQAAIESRPKQASFESNTDCEECGNPIPEQRRKIGGILFCVECQSKNERLASRFRQVML